MIRAALPLFAVALALFLDHAAPRLFVDPIAQARVMPDTLVFVQAVLLPDPTAPGPRDSSAVLNVEGYPYVQVVTRKDALGRTAVDLRCYRRRLWD